MKNILRPLALFGVVLALFAQQPIPGPVIGGGGSGIIRTGGTNGALFRNASGTVIATATGGAGTLCLTSANGGVPVWGSCAGSAATAWSSLTAPSAALALSVPAADTTQWTITGNTSTSNMFSIIDQTGNTGTGSLFEVHTVGTSAAKPFTFTAQGTANGIQMSTAGAVAKIGTGSIAADTAPVAGITGLGTGVGTWLATPSGANLASALTTPLPGSAGGTGVANTGFTITLAGNLITTGAFNTTFAAGATATMTLPTTSQTIPGMNQTNTAAASFTWNMGSATGSNALRIPNGAGKTVSVAGALAEDTTATMYHSFTGGVDSLFMTIPASATITNNDCTKFSVSGSVITLADAGACAGGGTVTSVSFTGGLISVATATTTPAFTVAGTSGGIPYFSGATTWATSAALTAHGVVIGGGAATAPTSTAAGTAGQVLTSNGASADPTFQTVTGTGTVTVVGGGSMTSTALVTSGGTTTIQTPSATATMDSSGNISTPGSVSSGVGGTVGGYYAFGQGTATVAPTSSVGFMAPTSVTTKFMMTLPAAPATGFMLNTGTTDPSVISFVAGNGTGNVVLTTSATLVTPNIGSAQAVVLAIGATPPTVPSGGTAGAIAMAEGTVPSAGCQVASVDCIYANATLHRFMARLNNAGDVPMVVGPASSTSGDVAVFSGTSGGVLQDTSLVAANIVFASAPGAGIAHFAGATQTVTSSAVSLTADVSGLLPLANGGTGANIAANTGGIFYSGASAAALLAGTATASLPLLSGSTAAPTWGTISYPTSANSGGIPYFSSATAISSSAALTVNLLIKGGGAGGAPAVSSITDNGTSISTAEAFATTSTLSAGSSPPACTAGTAGGICFTEGTALTNVAGSGALDANSTTHELEYQSNGSALKGMINRSQPSPIKSTALVASVSTATLCAASAGACNTAGQYLVHIAMYQSGSACSANTTNGVSFQLTWTDGNAVTHSAQTVPLETNSSLTALSGTMAWGATTVNAYASADFNIDTNGSVIQYATTFAQCTTGTATYALDASVTRVQ